MSIIENQQTANKMRDFSKILLAIGIAFFVIPFGSQAQQMSYLWSTGDTTANFSASPIVTTTYYVTVTQYGVSYVDSVTVVVNSVDTTYFTENACESFTWTQNGQTYTSTGIYTDTAVNNAGCDSVLVLDLTINQSTSGSESITACDSYTWAANGLTYTSSGTYVDTLINAAGCDSVATLNLTINTTTFAYDTALSVGPYTWPVTGLVYDTSGTYYDTTANTSGCDSITTLTLTVVDSLQISIGATDSIICEGSSTDIHVSISTKSNTADLKVGDYWNSGIVIYIFQPGDIKYVPGENHGIIAAPRDIPVRKTWGPYIAPALSAQYFGSLSNAIGFADVNTTRIIHISDSTAQSYPAARSCWNYTLGGDNDWYLPTVAEVNIMRTDFANNGLANFYTTTNQSASTQFAIHSVTGYWSSSLMGNAVGSIAPFMSNGVQCGCAKFESYWVRPVRYF